MNIVDHFVDVLKKMEWIVMAFLRVWRSIFKEILEENKTGCRSIDEEKHHDE